MSELHPLQTPSRPPRGTSARRVHVIETGRLVGNLTFLRGDGFASLLRRSEPYEFPAYSFIVEGPEGLIAIDTGMSARARTPRPLLQRRFVPRPLFGEEIGTRMRAAGLDPGEVRLVVLTHLDWDHAGGLAHFPGAEVLVHRSEWAFAQRLGGRLRYEPALWPAGFSPTVYDLEPEPCGPFPVSRAVTADGEVRLVPLGGHSAGQVGVVVRIGELRLLFCADHVLREDWFLEDYATGRRLGLGVWHPALAVETSERVHGFIGEFPTVLVPSHDEQAPARLAAAVD